MTSNLDDKLFAFCYCQDISNSGSPTIEHSASLDMSSKNVMFNLLKQIMKDVPANLDMSSKNIMLKFLKQIVKDIPENILFIITDFAVHSLSIVFIIGTTGPFFINKNFLVFLRTEKLLTSETEN